MACKRPTARVWKLKIIDFLLFGLEDPITFSKERKPVPCLIAHKEGQSLQFLRYQIILPIFPKLSAFFRRRDKHFAFLIFSPANFQQISLNVRNFSNEKKQFNSSLSIIPLPVRT